MPLHCHQPSTLGTAMKDVKDMSNRALGRSGTHIIIHLKKDFLGTAVLKSEFHEPSESMVWSGGRCRYCQENIGVSGFTKTS